ncbi:MAG: extracellular matrix regulator RemB [Syntrophaceticus sp.]
MFLHIGGDMMVPLDNVITILDLESGDQRERTLETLNYAAWNKEIIYVGKKGNKRSAIITDKNIFLSPISVYTLNKRSKHIFC